MSTTAGTDGFRAAAETGTGPRGQQSGTGTTSTGTTSTGSDQNDGVEDGDDGDDEDDGGEEESVESLQTKIKELEKDNARYRRERRSARTQNNAQRLQGKGTQNSGDQQGDVQAQINAAAAQARSDARAEYAESLAGTRIQAALEGLNIPDADQVVEDMNLSKFVDEDGNVDADAVKAVIDRYKALAPRRRRKTGHGNQGSQGNTASAEGAERAAVRQLFGSGQRS